MSDTLDTIAAIIDAALPRPDRSAEDRAAMLCYVALRQGVTIDALAARLGAEPRGELAYIAALDCLNVLSQYGRTLAAPLVTVALGAGRDGAPPERHATRAEARERAALALAQLRQFRRQDGGPNPCNAFF